MTLILLAAASVLCAVAAFRLGEAHPINYFAAGMTCFAVSELLQVL
jgi:hypothetical protein